MKNVLAALTVLLLSGLAQAQPVSGNRGIAPAHRRTSNDPAGVWVPGIDDPARGAPPRSGPAMVARSRAQFVSVTSLAAPAPARRAVERAHREMSKKNPDVAKAATELEKAVALHSSYAEAWLYLGGIRMVLNEDDQARRAFENAIAADSQFPYPYPLLALLEVREKHYAKAAWLTDFVLNFSPELIEAHYYRALAYGNLDDHKKARESIDAIVRAGEDKRFPGIHALLAVLFIREGDPLSAAAEYRRFLELDPDSPIAPHARQFLESVMSSCPTPAPSPRRPAENCGP